MNKKATVRVKIDLDMKKEIDIPNETTKKVFEYTDEGRDVIYFTDADEMFSHLGI